MTQGIVSVVKDGKTILKFVAGANGMKAPALAEWLRENWSEKLTLGEFYYQARAIGFGTKDCLWVVAKSESFSHTQDFMPPSYRETFDKPGWNPRWEFGTADYVEIVEVGAQPAATLQPLRDCETVVADEPLGPDRMRAALELAEKFIADEYKVRELSYLPDANEEELANLNEAETVLHAVRTALGKCICGGPMNDAVGAKCCTTTECCGYGPVVAKDGAA